MLTPNPLNWDSWDWQWRGEGGIPCLFKNEPLNTAAGVSPGLIKITELHELKIWPQNSDFLRLPESWFLKQPLELAICLSYSLPFIFLPLLGKSCLSLSPSFAEYFFNHPRPQRMFPRFLHHIPTALVFEDTDAPVSMNADLCMSSLSRLRIEPCLIHLFPKI